MWEFILDYATKHPQDPRSPEALHWLIHIGHYGQSHDHSGKRAFMLLHSRYPNSSWAKLNPFYYD
jgi:TolA-binding protein